ncbi:MAG: hypothetical protein ACXABY_23035 [Candidatus Thorarchaeota archaeon]|jgi:hypothetical protein
MPLSVGGSKDPDLLLDESFVGNAYNISGEIGKYNWLYFGNNGGASLPHHEAGHPGVIKFTGGTSDTLGRSGIVAGAGTEPFQVTEDGTSNSMELEWLIKLTGTISSGQLAMYTLGLSSNDWSQPGVPPDSICVQYDPSQSAFFRLAVSDAGGPAVFGGVGTTTVVLDTWYRVGFVYTDTGSGSSIQLKVNGVNEGTPMTDLDADNPLGFSMGAFVKADSSTNAGGTVPYVAVDHFRMIYRQNQED